MLKTGALRLAHQWHRACACLAADGTHHRRLLVHPAHMHVLRMSLGFALMRVIAHAAFAQKVSTERMRASPLFQGPTWA